MNTAAETLLYALAAGALSTFNPCSYTLLPAILSRFLARPQKSAGAGIRLGLALTAGTLLLFVGVASLVAAIGFSVGRAFPYLAIALAVALFLLGIRILGGRPAGLPARLRFSTPQPSDSSYRSAFLYGLAFGLGSLGCALPLFLTVAALSLNRGALHAFASISLYGLAMGAVMTALCLAIVLGQNALLQRIRPLGRLIEPLGGVLLIVAGGYLIYLNAGYLLFDYRSSAYLALAAALLTLLLGLAWRLVVTNGGARKIVS